jgi:hypothetical protein
MTHNDDVRLLLCDTMFAALVIMDYATASAAYEAWAALIPESAVEDEKESFAKAGQNLACLKALLGGVS